MSARIEDGPAREAGPAPDDGPARKAGPVSEAGPTRDGGQASGRPRRDPDVLIVGGGPAGSTLAGLLTDRGWHVNLVDRATFPRPKPCGECLNPGAVRTLRRLGLLDLVDSLDPRPLGGWDVFTGDATGTPPRRGGVGAGRLAARGRFEPDVEAGRAVSRIRLDAALLGEARRRGVQVEEGVQVRRVLPSEGGNRSTDPGGDLPSRTVETREADGSRGRRRARLVVGADGLRSVVGRALGAPARHPRLRKISLTAHVRGLDLPADRGRLVLTDHGTLGLAPLGPDLWNATVVVDPERDGAAVSRDPARFVLAVVRNRLGGTARRPTLAAGPWATGPFDRPVHRVAGEGLVLVGDAAGYYDPLTGQGMYRALRSAELAAPAIHAALEAAASGRGRRAAAKLAAYGRKLSRATHSGRRVQRIVESVVSRRTLRRLAVRRLAAAPAAMDALIRVTGDALPARSLLRSSTWMPLLLPNGGSASRSPVKRTGGPCEPSTRS